MAKTLKVNDKVRVISGDEKGKEAKIVKIDRTAGKACLEGIGIVESHVKKSYLNPAGGKKTIHVGIDLSNLKLVEAAKFEKTVAEKESRIAVLDSEIIQKQKHYGELSEELNTINIDSGKKRRRPAKAQRGACGSYLSVG